MIVGRVRCVHVRRAAVIGRDLSVTATRLVDLGGHVISLCPCGASAVQRFVDGIGVMRGDDVWGSVHGNQFDAGDLIVVVFIQFLLLLFSLLLFPWLLAGYLWKEKKRVSLNSLFSMV